MHLFQNKCLCLCSVLNSYFYYQTFVQLFQAFYDQQRGEGHIYGLRNLFENLRQNWKDSKRNVHLAWGWAPEMPWPAYLKCKKPRKTATYWVGLGERLQAEAHRALRSTVRALKKEPMHPPPCLHFSPCLPSPSQCILQ